MQNKIDDEIDQQTAGRSGRTVIYGLIVLSIICIICIYLNWLKMASLFGDPGRWLFESWKVANTSEIPYRDFSLQYPPLTTFLLGYAFRFFGSTFVTAQIFVDFFSISIVFLTWLLARKMLPEYMAIAVAGIIALQGALVPMDPVQLKLFSLNIYAVSMLVGITGNLLLLLGIADYTRSGALKTSQVAAIALGSFVSLLSKHEFIIGTFISLIALSLMDKGMAFRTRSFKDWLIRYAFIGIISFGPALVIYIVLGRIVGIDNLLTGMTGYGLANTACPWWPTGLGLIGGAVSLGWAVTVISLFSLPYFNYLVRRYSWKYGLLWLIALCGAVGFDFYYLYLLPKEGAHYGSLFRPIWLTVTVMDPILWFSVLFFIIKTGRIVTAFSRQRETSAETAILYVFAATGVALSLRSLFGTMMWSVPNAGMAAYPILAIIAAYCLLWLQRFFHNPMSGCPTPDLSPPDFGKLWHRVQANWAFLTLLLYSMISLFLLISLHVWSTHHRPHAGLLTLAGPVQLSVEDATSSEVYKFVMEHSQNQDAVLSIAYGGGINFAAHRNSPSFMTQYIFHAPPPRVLTLDMEHILLNPPKLVIAFDLPKLGSGYGCNERGDMVIIGCRFPEIVWSITEPAYSPNVPFPVVEYILANYKPGANIGDKIIYTRSVL